MMGYYLNDIQERLANGPESNGWEARRPHDFSFIFNFDRIFRK